jgi:hypothetical protein
MFAMSQKGAGGERFDGGEHLGGPDVEFTVLMEDGFGEVMGLGVNGPEAVGAGGGSLPGREFVVAVPMTAHIRPVTARRTKAEEMVGVQEETFMAPGLSQTMKTSPRATSRAKPAKPPERSSSRGRSTPRE